ncbi:hypothetical protein [Aquamicrobium terrae]|uniref:Type IV secretion system protein VirB7 n=1 Tax=Aquamicrobium terrae TaxID=1324945 RepID=A0ABV2N7Z1_9HYPH
MIRTIALLCMAAVLSGCAALSYPLPKCDGYSRRPLNRAMWEWEGNSNPGQKHSDAGSATSGSASSYAEEASSPAAFAHLGASDSTPPCKK